MQIIKTDGYNRYFDVMDFSELEPGDLFFSAGDVKYTLENGEMYLDFQIREVLTGARAFGNTAIIGTEL